MFLDNIRWYHIIGALVSGIILNIAGIIGFWTFLALIILAIIIGLVQYLPVWRRTVTAVILIGIIVAVGIPAVNNIFIGQWPATSQALQKQGAATDLKNYERLNLPGLTGIAAMRQLAEQKEQFKTAAALKDFEKATKHYAVDENDDAVEAEKSGRAKLEQAIAAREADAEYIKNKLRSVKVPAGWWESTKNFFNQIDVREMVTGTSSKSFPVRLLILGLILLVAGTLVFRRLSSGFGGIVVLLGGIAIVWGMFLLVTPEIAPAPPGAWPSIDAPQRQAAMPTSRQWTEIVHLQPGVLSKKIVPPSGVNFWTEGPADCEYELADGRKISISQSLGIRTIWLKGFRLVSPSGGVAEVHFKRRT